MREKIKLLKLIKYFALSLPVYLIFIIWEGGRFNVLTLSNSSFLFALVLSIVIMSQWLWHERAFVIFFENCKKFFFKNSSSIKRKVEKNNCRKPRSLQWYGMVISFVYYLFSIMLILFF